MVNNDSHSQKTKHIDIRFNLIKEQVQNNVIVMEHLYTVEMISDILTKALDPKAFLHLRPLLLGLSARLRATLGDSRGASEKIDVKNIDISTKILRD